MHAGRFGSSVVLQGAQPPTQVVLFLSGDEGFAGEAEDLAHDLAARGALVAGLSLRSYLSRLTAEPSNECSWPTVDFQSVVKRIEKSADLPGYVAPVLVGFHEGASMALTALAQAPPDTFRGLVTLGFCPDLDLPSAPCTEPGGIRWRPGRAKGRGRMSPPLTLPSPWLAIEDPARPACIDAPPAEFVSKTPEATLEAIETRGEGSGEFEPSRNTLASAIWNVGRGEARPRGTELAELADLPLVYMPATGPEGDTVAIFLSGDGGWASLDQHVGQYLNEHGIPVIGLNSLRYFWTQRTPEQVARDVERIFRGAVNGAPQKRVLLIGYSRGADTLGLVTSRLPKELRARVRGLNLIGPSTRVELEFHLADWIPNSQSEKGEPILPEILKLGGMKIACFKGTEEVVSLCPVMPPGVATQIEIQGDHHFGGDYDGIGRAIVETFR